MESVYLETTFISYLVARPSRDLIVAAHQQATQEWWTHRRGAFVCSVSQVVIDEASAGDASEAQKRLAIIGTLPALEVTEDAESLTQAIMAAGMLPQHAVRDAAHIAVGSSRDRLPADLELQALGKRPNRAENSSGLSESETTDAGNLHARRTHGSVASCGKTPSSRRFIEHVRSWPPNTNST